MITRETGFRTEHGFFETLEDAKRADLKKLLDFDEGKECLRCNNILTVLLEKKDRIIDILTTTERSLVKSRKIHGGTKKRKAAKSAPSFSDIPATV